VNTAVCIVKNSIAKFYFSNLKYYVDFVCMIFYLTFMLSCLVTEVVIGTALLCAYTKDDFRVKSENPYNFKVFE
jgi:hypothetical protein